MEPWIFVFHGNTEALAPLLSSESLGLRTQQGRTLLHYAAGKGRVDAIRILIERGADKEACDAYGAKPFHFAARCGNTQAMNILHGSDVDEKSLAGYTALHYAAWNGRREAVEWLLHNKACVGATTNVGDTPLHWAARSGSFHIVKLLLSHGADILVTNGKEELPLDLADSYGHDDIKSTLLQSMLTGKRPREVINKINGATTLHYWAYYAREEDTGLIALMPPYVDIADKEGKTPLYWAALRANLLAMKTLVKNGANVTADVLLVLMENFPSEEKGVKLAEYILNLRPKGTSNEWVSDIDNYLRCSSLVNEKVRSQLLEKFEEFWDVHKPWWSKATCEIFSKFKDTLDAKVHKPWWSKATCEIFSKFKETVDAKSWWNCGYWFDFLTNMEDFISDFPAIYLALYVKRKDIAEFIQRQNKNAINCKGIYTGRSALHWAIIFKDEKIVEQIFTTKAFQEELRFDDVDRYGNTATKYALTNDRLSSIDLSHHGQLRPVSEEISRVRIQFTNGLMVVAALMVNISFLCWLQPPKGPMQGSYLNNFWAWSGISFYAAIVALTYGICGSYKQGCITRLVVYPLLASILAIILGFSNAGLIVMPPKTGKTIINLGYVLFAIIFFILLAFIIDNIYNWKLLVSKKWMKDGTMEDDQVAEGRIMVGKYYEHVPWDDGLDIYSHDKYSTEEVVDDLECNYLCIVRM